VTDLDRSSSNRDRLEACNQIDWGGNGGYPGHYTEPGSVVEGLDEGEDIALRLGESLVVVTRPLWAAAWPPRN
jgi:hypothetical protein